jgi:hypothetical protein
VVDLLLEDVVAGLAGFDTGAAEDEPRLAGPVLSRFDIFVYRVSVRLSVIFYNWRKFFIFKEFFFIRFYFSLMN